MTVPTLSEHRRSLARGYARQVMADVRSGTADAGRLMNELHELAPNPQSRRRFAARLGRRRGVLAAAATKGGLVLTFRRHLDVTLQKDGSTLFHEERIAWTRVEAIAGRGIVSFCMHELHLTFHAIQRHVERSDAPMRTLLPHLDAEMVRLARRFMTAEPFEDGGDEYLPGHGGMWAGGREELVGEPDWGPAFAHGDARRPLFSIRTFLGVSELRPVLGLAWSAAMGAGGNGHDGPPFATLRKQTGRAA